MAARPRKVAEPAPAPSSPRFTKPNRSPCTKMTISCEGIVYDSSNAMRLWIISPRFPLNCDIFGTGEAIYRPTSPFLHNLSSILYRHSGWHRKRPRKGTGCLFSWLVSGGTSHPTSSPLASRALSSDPCFISIRGLPCSNETSTRPLSHLNQAAKRSAAKPRRGDRVAARGNGGRRARAGPKHSSLACFVRSPVTQNTRGVSASTDLRLGRSR